MAEAVKRPKIRSVEAALKVYYSSVDLGNAELRELFGNISSSTIVKLKNEVKKQMDAEGVMAYSRYTINKEIAYRMWGLDVTQLEKQQQKLMKIRAICSEPFKEGEKAITSNV